MDTEILWILMVTNVLNNSSKLIKRLGISQEKFLKYSSYAAKSSLKRVIEGEGKDSGQKKENETPKEVVVSKNSDSPKELQKTVRRKKKASPKKTLDTPLRKPQILYKKNWIGE